MPPTRCWAGSPQGSRIACAVLDGFFASVRDTSTPVRGVTDRAFATARSHLHMPALVSLNDLVVRRADEAGLIADRALAGPACRGRRRLGVAASGPTLLAQALGRWAGAALVR